MAKKPGKAQKPKKPVKEKKPRGRPSEYRPEFAAQVRKLLLLKIDATDTDIADFFGKSESTINQWKIDFPEFSESIRAGKTPADTEVAESLFSRACGAQWVEEMAFKVKTVEYADGKKIRETEEIKVVAVKKAAPPDTMAISLWLRNRRRDSWSEKPEPAPPAPDMPIGDEYTLKTDEPAPDAPIL